jgi:centromeric protein E
MNERSSRAHAIFKITIESKDKRKVNGKSRMSSLNLIDLAGSESARLTNATGERAREGKFINQSLLTLSTIIQRLCEDSQKSAGVRKQHLPYRDSKLTRLLEAALDGNAQVNQTAAHVFTLLLNSAVFFATPILKIVHSISPPSNPTQPSLYPP